MLTKSIARFLVTRNFFPGSILVYCVKAWNAGISAWRLDFAMMPIGQVMLGGVVAREAPSSDKGRMQGAFAPSGENQASAGLVVSISSEGLALSRRDETSPDQLSEEDRREVQELKQRDAEVRRHEQAHMAAAGRYATSGPQFEFTTGPDGRRYASGGHVSMDTGAERTPEATIAKAQTVRRAALAPAEPSGQDRAVASEAAQLETKARRELAEAQREGGIGSKTDGEDSASPLAPPETGGQATLDLLI
jgi:hypothetical protein